MHKTTKQYFKGIINSRGSLENVNQIGVILSITTVITVVNFYGEMWQQLNRPFMILMSMWFVINTIGVIISFSKRIVFKHQIAFTALEASVLSFFMVYLISLMVILTGIQSDNLTLKVNMNHVIGLTLCVIISFGFGFWDLRKKVIHGVSQKQRVAAYFSKVSPRYVFPFAIVGGLVARFGGDLKITVTLFVTYILALTFPAGLAMYFLFIKLKKQSREYWETPDFTKRIKPKPQIQPRNKKYLIYSGICTIIFLVVVPIIGIVFIRMLEISELTPILNPLWFIDFILIWYFLYKYYRSNKVRIKT